jgi:hypothetical protein
LVLVDHLSSRWGTAREPDSDQRFYVWFELDVSDRQSQPVAASG